MLSSRRTKIAVIVAWLALLTLTVAAVLVFTGSLGAGAVSLQHELIACTNCYHLC